MDGTSLKTEWHIEQVPLSEEMFTGSERERITENEEGRFVHDVEGWPIKNEFRPVEETGKLIEAKD